MKYKAVFTDDFLSYFRLDDNGKTLVLTDKQGHTRAVTLEVEVEPKHGKWEDVEEVLYEGNTDGTPYTVMSVGYKCSECGNEMGNLWSFCPNCGAKMEVERSEDEEA